MQIPKQVMLRLISEKSGLIVEGKYTKVWEKTDGSSLLINGDDLKKITNAKVKKVISKI